MRSILLVAGCMLMATWAAAATSGPAVSPKLSVSWRLIENRTSNQSNQYDAELTIHNEGAEALPPRWSLYFNSIGTLLPESVTGPLVLRHITGDFYELRPNDNCPAIAAGGQMSLHWTGTPWAINVTDAPNGFYVILRDDAGDDGAPAIVTTHVEDFPDAKVIRRGEGDATPVVTPESRYAENAKLTLLPAGELPPVVPSPVELQRRDGFVTIDQLTVIDCDPALAGEAKFLAGALEQLIGKGLEIGSANGARANSIRLRIGDVQVAGATKKPGDEAYSLVIRPGEGVEIIGTDTAAVFYGIQTLRALAPIESFREKTPQLKLDAVEVHDAPRFGYRGVMLDVARNFQSVEAVKQLLDLMAFYKFNRFHFHLTDDEGWRLEVKSLPELTAVGARRGHTEDESDRLVPSHGSGPVVEPGQGGGTGFYTQDELIDLLRYANDRHITVIPEIEVPGHARAAIKSMERRAKNLTEAGKPDEGAACLLTDPKDASKYNSVQSYDDNVIDVGLESSYRFLDQVVGELADVYHRAGLRLECVHLGGDEVPDGAWSASTACQRIPTAAKSGRERAQQLQVRFLKRACELLAKRGIRVACWDDCLLVDPKTDSGAKALSADEWPERPIAYAWNNVPNWGHEDAAYRLANAGFDVVLCNATHLYFDFACSKDPAEPGLYWAGFVEMRAPFAFNPLDVFQGATRDSMGHPIAPEHYQAKTRLTAEGKQHILGLQGCLWGEMLFGPERLEYMAFPRTIALAERTWAAEPAWVGIADPGERDAALEAAWNQFANQLGQRELPRLDVMAPKLRYRLPPPGAILRDGHLSANVAFPGLAIRYRVDGSNQQNEWRGYQEPVAVAGGVELQSMNMRGRGSRVVRVGPESQR